MMAFFRYWCNEWRTSNETEKHMLFYLCLCVVLLLAIPVILVVFMFAHKANVDKEAAEWRVYKNTYKCVAVAQKPPYEEVRLSGKVSTRELVAGDVVWKCDNGFVVRSWEKSK